jgi:hypothetical protein
LRLPERLQRPASRWYSVTDFEVFSTGRPPSPLSGDAAGLKGVLCAGAREAESAAAAGAQFLAIRSALAPADVTFLCKRVCVPVFVRGVSLQRAWAQGASGINGLAG